MSVMETYRIAHTARCKLQLAADRPDRNLRFILGHAFTLDNLRLQIAQIEEAMDSESDEEDDIDTHIAPPARLVSFSKSAHGPVSSPGRRRSPPPDKTAGHLDPGGLLDGEEEDDDEEDGDLRLERFGSATEQLPRMIDDDGEDEEEEPNSPPDSPSEEELRLVTEGAGNAGLTDMYQRVAGCPCHGHHGPAAEKVWEIPQKAEGPGLRLAVVQIAA
jgi:hypothetical protein